MPGKSKIGEVLLETGVIEEGQLEEALRDQELYGGRLATIMLEKCFISERQYLGALMKQLGLKAVEFRGKTVPEQALKMISYDVASRYQVFPFGLVDGEHGKELWVAMSDPTDLSVLDSLRALTGLNVRAALALESVIRYMIHDYYAVHNGHGDYVLEEDVVSDFCDTPDTIVAGLEHLQEREVQGFDSLYHGSRVERELGEAVDISGRAGRSSGRPVADEVEALVGLLVEKGLIREGEYFRRLAERRS